MNYECDVFNLYKLIFFNELNIIHDINLHIFDKK